MTDQPRKPDDHSDAVHAAFDDLHEKLGDRATPEAKARVEALREATLAQDGARVKAHLEAMKESQGWLWTELTSHPRVAALVNELALFGL
jgi:hypothetical protein